MDCGLRVFKCNNQIVVKDRLKADSMSNLIFDERKNLPVLAIRKEN